MTTTDQCKVDNMKCTINVKINGKIQVSIAKDILVDALGIPFTDKITFTKALLKNNFEATLDSLANKPRYCFD